MVSALVDGDGGEASDSELANAVRHGDVAAYGVLYARHLGAARRVACLFAASVAEQEDLVAEGFARVLRVLRGDGGPSNGFRAYLVTTMRNTATGWRRREAALSLVAEVPEVRPGTGADEVVSVRMQAEIAAEAFASLPERWRVVLWQTEVEGESPARVGARLGMTPNSISALAYRPREGLRRAYLDHHVRPSTRRGCDSVVSELAGWVRDRFPPPKMRKIAAHLRGCAECRDTAAGLRQLNRELPCVSLGGERRRE